MKLKKLLLLLVLFLISLQTSAQSISSELIAYELLKAPKFFVDENQRTLKVTVTSPYHLTSDAVLAQSKVDYQTDLKNYDKVVQNSASEYQQKLKEYEADLVKAKAKFELESAEFKKLSIIERLTMTDQGKSPKLITPSRPEYYKPLQPTYSEPNLNDYIILNNDVIASQINIDGFSHDGNYVTVLLDIQKLNFQDNAGQTFANQPTKLMVSVNGMEKVNATFFKEYKFVSSSPSNNINKPLAEKNFLNDVLKYVNAYLNDNFGYQSIKSTVSILSVKNKGGKYDDLERADISVKTNLRKLNPQNDEMTKSALSNLEKVATLWKETLARVDYKNKKSDYNSKIAAFLYFNLIRLNLVVSNKVEAEKYLNAMQENMIYMDLSSDDKNALKNIETEIYKKK